MRTAQIMKAPRGPNARRRMPQKRFFAISNRSGGCCSAGLLWSSALTAREFYHGKHDRKLTGARVESTNLSRMQAKTE